MESEKRSVKATLTLYEGVLNDDELEILESQYVYTGRNHATCKITYWTFANEWANHKHEKYFQKVESAIDWYKKHFEDRATEQGKSWLYDYYFGHLKYDERPKYEEKIAEYTIEDAMNEWESNITSCEI